MRYHYFVFFALCHPDYPGGWGWANAEVRNCDPIRDIADLREIEQHLLALHQAQDGRFTYVLIQNYQLLRSEPDDRTDERHGDDRDPAIRLLSTVFPVGVC